MLLLEVRPVIDEAVTEVAHRGLIKRESTLRFTFVDTNSSESLGPYEIVDNYYRGNADIVMGLANIYTLAPMARMMPFWDTPIVTTTGLVGDFDNKHDQYKLLTRVSGSYTVLGNMIVCIVRAANFPRGILYEQVL